MKLKFIISFMVLAIFAACQQGGITSLDTEDQKLAYSMGVSVGQNMKSTDFANIEVAKFTGGIKDFLAGGDLEVTAGDAQKLLSSFFSRKKADPTLQPDDIGKLSYAYGISMGRNFENSELTELDLDYFSAGMNQFLQGEEMLMTEEEAKKTQGDYFQTLREKQNLEMQKRGEENLAKGAAFLEENGKKEGVVTLDSGLQYEIITKGNGKTPGPNDKVKTHYHGTLIDGTVFDSSVDRGEPISFPVGGVIKGWTEALQLMPVGSKWKLFIPGDLAYGLRGSPPKIAPNETLVFDVELIDIE